MKKIIVIITILFLCGTCKTEQEKPKEETTKSEIETKPVVESKSETKPVVESKPETKPVVESKPETKPVIESPKEKNWSEDHRNMNWFEAKEKCASIGMRLPTREEMIKAHESGITKTWKYRDYWTSEDYSIINKDDNAYTFTIDDDDIDMSHKETLHHVRCIR